VNGSGNGQATRALAVVERLVLELVEAAGVLSDPAADDEDRARALGYVERMQAADEGHRPGARAPLLALVSAIDSAASDLGRSDQELVELVVGTMRGGWPELADRLDPVRLAMVVRVWGEPGGRGKTGSKKWVEVHALALAAGLDVGATGGDAVRQVWARHQAARKKLWQRIRQAEATKPRAGVAVARLALK
jgi:hypothetical protein